jgi:phenylacetate-CoA ligase
VTVRSESEASSLAISVVAPCFNEALNLRELVRRTLQAFERGALPGELILVDDGSSDETWAVIQELEVEHPDQVRGRKHAANSGIVAGWRTGLGAARAPVVGLIDADLQYQPEDLIRLHRELLEHSLDIVQGWRSLVGRDRDSRYHISRGFCWLLNKTFGMDLRDNKSGFIVCSKDVLADLLTFEGDYAHWQSFIMVAAHAKGYAYKEVETLFASRHAGESFLEGRTAGTSAQAFVDLFKATREYRVKRRPRGVDHPFLQRNPVPEPKRSRSLGKRLRWQAYMGTFNSSHWLISRKVEDYFEALQKTQWLPPDQIRELQDEKLRRLVRHSYRNVPFYRERMRAAGLRPESIQGQADLHRLPMLTKADIRDHLHFDILSENHDKSQVLRVTTSGSTGSPFECYVDRAQLEFRWAATLRSQEWTGYEFGDPCVRLWHQTLGLTKSQIVMERMDALLCKRLFVPVFSMQEEKLRKMVQSIAAHEPVMLDGYAEALDLLAKWSQTRGIEGIRPRAVMSSAQTLPASSRKLIEDAFGCEVYDKYGAREFSGIAYECGAHSGHHVVAESYVVEVLKGGVPAKPGEIGEVVITDLNNYCLPFIRYRIGDLAVAADPNKRCSCGRGLPMIGDIEGRVQSIIQGTEGRYLPGSFFFHYLRKFHYAIDRFQVIQERPGHVTLRVVKGGRWSKAVRDEITDTFHTFLGRGMQIEIVFVKEVQLVRTGKLMGSISKIPLDFQTAALEAVDARAAD